MRIRFTQKPALLVAGMAVAIAIPLTACGGGSPLASPASGGRVSATSGDEADVQACTTLKTAAATFLANKSQDNLDAFAAALADRPGPAMSPSLDTAFGALSDDIQNEMLGDSAAAAGVSDQNAVAEGCAGAGVQMPAGFTG